MFSAEQRRIAIETFIKYDHSYADTIAELGYPNRATLRLWWREYESTGEIPEGRGTRRSKYTDEQMTAAVDRYLEHGRSLSRTMRAMDLVLVGVGSHRRESGGPRRPWGRHRAGARPVTSRTQTD